MKKLTIALSVAGLFLVSCGGEAKPAETEAKAPTKEEVKKKGAEMEKTERKEIKTEDVAPKKEQKELKAAAPDNKMKGMKKAPSKPNDKPAPSRGGAGKGGF